MLRRRRRGQRGGGGGGGGGGVSLLLLLLLCCCRSHLPPAPGRDLGLPSQRRVPGEAREPALERGREGLFVPRQGVERRGLGGERAGERGRGGRGRARAAAAAAAGSCSQEPEGFPRVPQGLAGAGEAQEDEGAVALCERKQSGFGGVSFFVCARGKKGRRARRRRRRRRKKKKKPPRFFFHFSHQKQTCRSLWTTPRLLDASIAAEYPSRAPSRSPARWRAAALEWSAASEGGGAGEALLLLLGREGEGEEAGERRWSFCDAGLLAEKASAEEASASPLLLLLLLLFFCCGELALVAGGTFSIVIFFGRGGGKKKKERE